MSKLRIAGVVNDSIVDGEGLRFTIFTQGCMHDCKGCHNPKTHPLNGGHEADTDELFERIKKNGLLSGVTFSGGEPMLQVKPLLDLARRIKAETDLNIIIYSGYTHEELLEFKNDDINELLSHCYQLIDGRFVEEEKDLTLDFRGSKNQRIIALNKK